MDDDVRQQLAFDLAKFLKELQSIDNVDGPLPGQHNWWRGYHVSVYDKGATEQIAKLTDIIDADKAMNLWERACKTRWDKPLLWIHGDFAIDNLKERYFIELFSKMRYNSSVVCQKNQCEVYPYHENYFLK